MRKFFVLATCFAVLGSPAYGQQSDRLGFVKMFIEQLSSMESVRSRAADEKAATQSEIFENCVRSMETFRLELGAEIAQTREYQLDGEFKDLPTTLAAFYEQKQNLYGRIGDNCGAMISQKPGVDYGELAANAPKLTAGVDFADRSIFQASPLVFGMLISDAPDAQGHASHLIITRAERDDIVRSINIDFGEKVDEKNPNYLVSAAKVIRFYLTQKGYKCSDEP